LRLNPRAAAWAGATLTIFAAAGSAARSLPTDLTAFFLLGSAGLSLIIAAAVSVDWCEK
jgi:hypothetical protein